MTLMKARIVDKPWGHEEIFAETEFYVGKILFVKEGEALSLQFHEKKTETLRVLDGQLNLTTGLDPEKLECVELQSGDVFHIEPGRVHRMVGASDCHILEVSTPELDDVVRLDDRYGREGTNQP
ncbi:MAG: cupin domain-containing protein [bacterium]|nr:cupin domain-containing protein [bacterium]